MSYPGASEEMGRYFDALQEGVGEAFSLALEARAEGYDPDDHVEVALAANLAERVIGLISIVAPQIKGSGVVERILALEEEYGKLDWRVALVIALEVAQEKYCRFKDRIEAIETGIRVGFAYVTVGVVSAPLEGFTKLELKSRNDGKGQYFSLWYSGPIRNAGGTAAAVSVLIADYIRKHLGYAEYDPTEKETRRCHAELEDYHSFITNLQYYPSEEESEFLLQHLPVEIDGDESEKYEVSNVVLKDLPRVKGNKLRNGYCLIHSSCIPLKAPKLWAKLEKWGRAFGLEHWAFLKEFNALQKRIKAKGRKEETAKLAPDYTYIHDLVAGRPVFAHPLRPGGWRLRYGRSRASGYSGQAIHPASMLVLKEFLATGTQLKVERPGKAAAFTPCDSIEGPIVKLQDGSVTRLRTEAAARKVRNEIAEILYLGDVLVNYGDFFDRAHALVPAGYCSEWWAAEVERAAMADQSLPDYRKMAALSEVPAERIELLLQRKAEPTFAEALRIAKGTGTPLHPAHTLFWKLLSEAELRALLAHFTVASREGGKLSFQYTEKEETHRMAKHALETLGVEHLLVEGETILLAGDAVQQLLVPLGLGESLDAFGQALRELPEKCEALAFVNMRSPVRIRDAAGTFIGSRMGRPEKAKMREMTGSPHTLFPIGEEGGRLRSFQSALEKGRVHSNWPVCYCPVCKQETPLFRCETCDSRTVRLKYCPQCGTVEECPHRARPSSVRAIDLKRIFAGCLKKMGTSIYPDLIKGVRGTSNSEHIPEHPIKGILRAKHNIHVNKDGTLRYDASEVTLTHFKAKEIGVPVAKLRELGYEHDVHGEPLTHEEQVLELKAQDVVLPCCPENPEEPADEVFFRATQFVDELLTTLYGKRPFYSLESKEGLVGQLIIGLAPHTSAGILGRIIGFSKTQGFLAHPYFHAAMRRDCFTADTFIPLKKDGLWSVERIGDIVESLRPTKMVDAHGTLEARPKGYTTLGTVGGKVVEVPVNNFTKHTPMPIIALTTALGKRLRTTANHKHVVVRDGEEAVVRAEELNVGDVVKLPYVLPVPSRDVKEIDLLEELGGEEWLVVRGLKRLVPDLRAELRRFIPSRSAENFSRRDSVPAPIARKVMEKHGIGAMNVRVAAKRDTVTLPAVIPISIDFLNCVGLYVAEGYARQQKGAKGSYQVYIAAEKEEIRSYVRRTFRALGLTPSERKRDRVTYSSRILFTLFTQLLGAGASAYEKRLPARFLQLPPARLGGLLSGYFEGDGSVSARDLRIVFDTVSEGLLHDLEFALGRLGVFVKLRRSTRLPGKIIRSFYERRGRSVPAFTCTRGVIQSKFVHRLSKHIAFLSQEKRERHALMLRHKRFRNLFCRYDDNFFYDEIISLEEQTPEESYCLNVGKHHVIANGILTRQCDGDEACFLLLMDAFLNFSRKYLPESRGSTMDAPLVLTSVLTPSEVDDMAFHVDIAWKYPLELYEAALSFRKPWEVSVPQIKEVLGSEAQFEGMGYTHETNDINAGVRCSAYKLLPSMQEKLIGQMALAEQIRACDASDVARLVIEKHFIRDTKGNLRKFSQQQYRCVRCNEKYRRPPLRGNCAACGGRVIFTISEGSVVKYLEPSLSLAYKYDVPVYLKQDLELTKRRVESVFGKDAERQEGLGQWFG